MTREEAKSRAKLYSALAEGKTIQVLSCKGEWIDIKTDELDYLKNYYKYRIKLEPKYRPFKSQEECWNEMHKHSNFGWIKGNTTGEYKQIVRIYNYKSELIFNIGYNGSADYSSETLFNSYTFADGIPFGIKEEYL